ncbi:hypothetical protein D6R50_24015 [Aeromonas veronii]|uniref:Uncharacterized protein n=1 Tax=Aeromonas veronii TaxID=654 RepID=A0A3A9HYG9_AERVE|nr:hypothetical protein [Aeromonas veronii]RKJ83775.1 hypothetical protein D6R50_24015 [Aeromonas veronii]
MRAEAIEHNQLEQALTLRRHYLPGEGDELDSLARALWLDKYFAERSANSVAHGIATAFNG